MILVQFDEDGQIIHATALPWPRRDRVDATAARHAYNRAKYYAEQLLYFREPIDSFDRLEKFSSAMDNFLPFCLFCRRYIELVPNCQFGGFSILVTEVPDSERHFGVSKNAVSVNKSMRSVVERVIHCRFHYPIFKRPENETDSFALMIAGCEIKSDRQGVYQIEFSDLIDAFLNHLPTDLESFESEQYAEDAAERAKMLQDFYQSDNPQKLAHAAIAELKREGEA